MPAPSITSSCSPTPSNVSRAPNHNMTSIRESIPEDQSVVHSQRDLMDLRSVYGAETIIDDSDDDDVLTCSGDGSDEKSVGLFDVVKRDFRVKTAVITNRPDYGPVQRKPKVNFIQDMKTKVGIALEYKNKGTEEMQAKDLKQATRYFHLALLNLKGLDPDEGVLWSGDFESMDKDRMPLRVMPNELKEIKEGVEVDCYLGLAGCLQYKERVPYRKIKEYCVKVLNIRDDYVPALVKCGMACYYLREYELCRFNLQTAKDLSPEPMDPEIKKYLHMVENQLTKMRKRK